MEITLIMDYKKTMEEMIEEGNYLKVEEVRNMFRFSEEKERGIVEEIAKISPAEREPLEGFHFATLRELLALGTQFPKLQKDYEIIARKSVFDHPFGDGYSPCLTTRTHCHRIQTGMHKDIPVPIYKDHYTRGDERVLSVTSLCCLSYNGKYSYLNIKNK